MISILAASALAFAQPQAVSSFEMSRINGCARDDADAEFLAGGCKITTPATKCYECIADHCSADCTTHCQDICDGLLAARLGFDGWDMDDLSVMLIQADWFDGPVLDDERADILAAMSLRKTTDGPERWVRIEASDQLRKHALGEVEMSDTAREQMVAVVLAGLISENWKVRYASWQYAADSMIWADESDLAVSLVIFSTEPDPRIKEHAYCVILDWFWANP